MSSSRCLGAINSLKGLPFNSAAGYPKETRAGFIDLEQGTLNIENENNFLGSAHGDGGLDLADLLGMGITGMAPSITGSMASSCGSIKSWPPADLAAA